MRFGEVTGGFGFIFASYAVTLVVMAGLILWVILDRRRQDRRLAELEARGIRRRSDRRNPAAPAGPKVAEAPPMAREHKA
jgi:heme exporter protein D